MPQDYRFQHQVRQVHPKTALRFLYNLFRYSWICTATEPFHSNHQTRQCPSPYGSDASTPVPVATRRTLFASTLRPLSAPSALTPSAPERFLALKHTRVLTTTWGTIINPIPEVASPNNLLPCKALARRGPRPCPPTYPHHPHHTTPHCNGEPPGRTADRPMVHTSNPADARYSL